MGFKRTTDGRVFFDTDVKKSQPSEPQKKTVVPAPANKASNTSAITKKEQDDLQKQILTLLRGLNLKLQSSENDKNALQDELNQTRTLIKNLEKKTEASEKKTKALEKKLQTQTKSVETESQTSRQIFEETLKEFEETRKLMLDIEDKAQQAEVAVHKQSAQLRRNQDIINSKIEKIESAQKKTGQELVLRLDHQERAQKQLDARIEENTSNTSKLERKVEKSSQDRSRLVRKLERIEETVLQTNDALNARALVLLTDQATAQNSGHPHIPATADSDKETLITTKPQGSNDNDDSTASPWWRRSYKLQAASMASLLVIGTLAGWVISDVQKPQGILQTYSDTELQELENFQEAHVSATNSNVKNEPIDITEDPTFELGENFKDNVEQIIKQDEAFEISDATQPSDEKQINKTPEASPDPINDVDAIDINNQEQLLALMEETPKTVAKELNKIEPSNAAQGISEAVVKKPQLVSLKNDLTPLEGHLSERIKPDTTLPTALKIIEDKAFKGHGDAQHDLGALYITGYEGLQPDYSRAIAWLTEAAHQDIANARYNLGVIHHQGIGMEQDMERALEWYKSAAALDHPEAQYNLGMAYIEGIGVEYNPPMAAGFFEKSAKAGVMEAAYNLGLIYENGLLGKTQPDTALMWYKTASDNGSPEAKAALEQLANNLGIQLFDVNKLVESMKVIEGAQTQKKTPPANKNTDAVKKQKRAAVDIKAEKQVSVIADVQNELMALGLYPGPANGHESMITRDAVRSYQSQNGLPTTGTIDMALLNHMRSQSMEGSNDLGSRE